MKDLLSKEHYSYEIDTLLMKSSASLPYMDNPPTNNGGGGGVTLWYDKASFSIFHLSAYYSYCPTHYWLIYFKLSTEFFQQDFVIPKLDAFGWHKNSLFSIFNYLNDRKQIN